jgi:Cupin-like domain
MKKASWSKGRAAKRPRSSESTNGHHETDSPIHVVPSASPKPIGMNSANLLHDLLYPMTHHEFMTRDFRRRAVHLQVRSNGKSENRFQSIIEEGMHNLDTLELLKQTSSDSIFVWLASPEESKGEASRKKNAYPNPLVQSIEMPDAESAFALHRAGGHALYCRAPSPVEQVLVAKLLADTGIGCGHYDPSGESISSLARGEVEMFLSGRPGGVTDWHYDFQENFTLQLTGVKQWTLQRGTVTHPLRACTPHYKAPDVVENQLKAAHLSNPEFLFEQPTIVDDPDPHMDQQHNAIGPTDTATLHPGDVLYFPAGMWHKVKVLEPGISINVSLMATNYAAVTCQALQHLLLQRDEWRQVVVHQPGMHNLNAVHHLKQLLKDLPKIIQNLELNLGGANAILPPFLLNPPNFQLKASSSQDKQDMEQLATVSKQNDDSSNKDSVDENLEGGEEASLDQMTHDESEGVKDNIIDACRFEYPVGSSGPCPMDQTATLLSCDRLVRNPLASLIRMDEVKGYYSRRSGNNDDGDDYEELQKLLFVLNVNYAGVDSHESTIRIIMRDNTETRYMNKLYNAMPKSKHVVIRKREQACNECMEQITTLCPNLIHCLMYYGYFALINQKTEK